MTNSITVIFPLYNEEKRLHLAFKDIIKFNKKNKFSKIEYLFVDDGSVDNSSHKILKFFTDNKKKKY